MPEASGITEYEIGKPPSIKKLAPKPSETGKGEISAKSDEIPDEFENKDVPTLKPLKQVAISEDTKGKDYSEVLKEEFEYLSRTRDLEVDTKRTLILQNIVDKMTEGTNIKTRVVIMGKGLETNAFTTADGTIFVSQALINSLESMDEIGGVLAHEAGHLIFKTFERVTSAPGVLCEFGGSFAHEIAPDLKAPQLLVKAGLKSDGFIEAIPKLGKERGLAHQAGLMRSAQNIALHAVMDFETSNIRETRIEQFLQTADITPTNYECFLASIFYSTYDTREVLSKLHSRDLIKAKSFLASSSYETETDLTKRRKIEVLQDLARKRLTDKGYGEDDIDLLFLLSQGYPELASFRFIKTPERLVELTSNLKSFIDQKKLSTMYGLVFEDDYPHLGGESIPTRLLENLRNHAFDPNLEIKDEKAFGIPVTQDSLFQTISIINNLPEEYFGGIDKSNAITKLLAHYIDDVLDLETSRNYDKAREILLKAKDLNFPIKTGLIDRGDWAKSIYAEVFGEEKKETIELNSIMDSFIENYFKGQDMDKDDVFMKHVSLIKAQLELQGGGDRKLLSGLEYFAQKLDAANVEITYSLPYFLDTGRYKATEAQEVGINQKILKFNLKTTVALATFRTDGPEFYSFVSKSMQDLGIDPKSLSKMQLIKLTGNLISGSDNASVYHQKDRAKSDVRTETVLIHNGVKIRNYEKFSELSLIKELTERRENLSFGNLKELNQYLAKARENGIYFEIYGDSFESVVLGREIRGEFDRLLRIGIDESEYTDLYSFINSFFPESPQKQELLRQLNQAYLDSEKPTIEEKIDHFERNADQLGPEGAIMVADQITTMDEYERLRNALGRKLEEYLSGESEKVGKVAVLDNLTSELVNNFGILIKTSETDPKIKRETMNDIARMWTRINIEYGSSRGVHYDKESKKVVLDGKGRDTFKTLADTVAYLKNRTPLQKFLLAQKALLDKGGALSSDKNREVLSETLVNALNPESSFVAKALKIGAKTAAPDYISFPASQIFSSILFEGLDMSSVDSIYFNNSQVPASEIYKIAKLGTREATYFGERYSETPSAEVAKEAQTSNSQYNRAIEMLNAMLDMSGAERKESKVSSSTEAIIRGVEMSGALGVRSLQLARQLHKFSPQLDQRLSQSFDARPGMSKLSFWEHLYLANGKNGLGTFVDRLISVDEFLGGGSLYTTYAATVWEGGVKRKIALKMLNPNAEMFIKMSYAEATKILDHVLSTGTAQEKQYAEMSQLFLDLSKTWCLKDIKDPTFQQDDASFRGIIEGYNKAYGVNTVYAPELVLTTTKIKAEGIAAGRTLNQVLNDPRTSVEGKRKAVQEVVRFYEYQLQTPITDETGKPVHLIHSDPHIGNFVVDFNESGPRIGVIDRNMYLRMKPEDVEVFRPLIQGKSYSSMLEPMINRLMDISGLTDAKIRESKKRTIINGVRKEFAVQTWNSLRSFRIGVNNFSLLRRFMEEASQAGIKIPLEYQLMIRNIEAFRELQRRYPSPKPS